MANNTCAIPPELYQGDGTTKDFSFAFQYIKKEDVIVYLWDETTKKYIPCTDVGTSASCSTTPISPYEYYWKSAVEITFCQPPGLPPADRESTFANVLIGRSVDICAMVAYFYAGTSIRAQDLNNDFTQVLLALQDVESRLYRALVELQIEVDQIVGIIKEDDMQNQPYPQWTDKTIGTAAADVRYFSTLVQEQIPDANYHYEVGKTWLQNDVNKTLSIWDGSKWVGVASGGTFTVQPTTIYVDSVNGIDTNDGHRIINPMRTIKAAVAQCNTVTVATTSTITAATYDNLTGLATFTTNTPHDLYVGTKLTFSPQTWSCDTGSLNFPEANDPARYCTKVLSPTQFEVQMETSSKVHTFVPSSPTVTGTAGFLGDGWIIRCAPGVYQEEASIEVKARNVTIAGASIRSTFIHPTTATEYNTLFLVDSGFYLKDFTLAGFKADSVLGAAETVYSDLSSDYKVVDSNVNHGLPARQAFIIALRKGSIIRKSPYVQNCTNFADSGINNDNFDPNNLQGEGGDLTSSPTAGGILCDGSAPDPTSPLRSFVVDAFTQIALDGPGILCTNNGYAQLVSFFGTFCRYHGKSLNGGQLNLSNCTTDFGKYGLIAEGRSPDDLITGTIDGNYNGPTTTVSPTVNITTAVYDNVSGVATFTTDVDHQLSPGYLLTFTPMEWSCSLGNKNYPEADDPVRQVDGVISPTQFEVKMEPSTFTHTYVSGGTVYGTNYDSPGDVSFDVKNLAVANNFTTKQPGKTMVVLIGSDIYPILRVSEVGNGTTCNVTISNPKVSQRNLNLGLLNAVTDGTACSFRLQSYISTGGHTFEFVGSGTDYRAHPEYGGIPDDSKQVVETGGTGPNAQFNGGRVWLSATDQDGQFKVGSTLIVDQKTGYINIDPSSVSSNVSSDLSPTLGGDLDVNGFDIVGDRNNGNGDITLHVNGNSLIDLDTTAAAKMPVGTTAQQPSAPAVGYFRYNTDINLPEVWNGTEWGELGAPPNIGTNPEQIPLNQYLGKQAFVDEVGSLRPYFASSKGFYSAPQAKGDIQFRYVSDTSVQLVMKGLDGVLRSTTLTLS